MTEARSNPPKTVMTEDGEVWSASTKIDGQRVVIALFYDDTDAEVVWNVSLLVGATRKAKKSVRKTAWWGDEYVGRSTGRVGLRALKWAVDQIDLFQTEYPDATVVTGWYDDKRRRAYAALTRYGFKLGTYKEEPVYFRTAEDFQARPRTRRNPMSRCPISGKFVARDNPGTPKVTKPDGEEVIFCCPSHKKRYLRENPVKFNREMQEAILNILANDYAHRFISPNPEFYEMDPYDQRGEIYGVWHYRLRQMVDDPFPSNEQRQDALTKFMAEHFNLRKRDVKTILRRGVRSEGPRQLEEARELAPGKLLYDRKSVEYTIRDADIRAQQWADARAQRRVERAEEKEDERFTQDILSLVGQADPLDMVPGTEGLYIHVFNTMPQPTTASQFRDFMGISGEVCFSTMDEGRTLYVPRKQNAFLAVVVKATPRLYSCGDVYSQRDYRGSRYPTRYAPEWSAHDEAFVSPVESELRAILVSPKHWHLRKIKKAAEALGVNLIIMRPPPYKREEKSDDEDKEVFGWLYNVLWWGDIYPKHIDLNVFGEMDVDRELPVRKRKYKSRPRRRKPKYKKNPGAVDPQGRYIPEKYLAGLPPELRAARIRELGESRSEYGTGDFSELPTDRAARKMGLVKLSAYRVVAQQRGFDISQVSDMKDMATKALRYYGVKPTAAVVNKLAAGLEKVYAKGLAAWKSGGHRPGATGRNWADARVASVLVGGKAAWTADSKQFNMLPPKARQAAISQLPELYEALAAQGRQRDINYIQKASGMTAHDNPSWADFKRGFSRAGKSAKKTAAYAKKRASLNAKLSKAKKRQAKAQADMDYLMKCMDRLHVKPRDLNAFGREVVESMQAEVRRTARATAEAKKELRRFIKARNNPLVGWRNESGATPKDVHRSHKQLYSPTAERRFAKKFRPVPLDIEVVLSDAPSRRIPEELKDEAQMTGKTILYINEPVDIDKRSIENIRQHLGLDLEEGGSRLTSMTAFTLLHRMGDRIMDTVRRLNRDTFLSEHEAKIIDEFPFDQRLFNALDQNRLEHQGDWSYFSAGVDTAAGRKNLINNWNNVIADLWAKYLISGRVAYNPDAGEQDTRREKQLRGALKMALEAYFPIWKESAKGMVFSIGLSNSLRDLSAIAFARSQGLRGNPRGRSGRVRHNPAVDPRILDLISHSDPKVRDQGLELARILGHSDSDILRELEPSVIELLIIDAIVANPNGADEEDVALTMYGEIFEMAKQLPDENVYFDMLDSVDRIQARGRMVTTHMALDDMISRLNASESQMRDVLLRAAAQQKVKVLP